MITAKSIETGSWKGRLDLPIYRLGSAARYARTNVQRVSYWHRGAGGLRHVTLKRSHEVLLLSYLELIEVAFVATMRELGISLTKIRRTREYAAKELSSRHPFAEYDWKTNGVHLLLGLKQVDEDAHFDNAIVGNQYGQIGWHQLLDERFSEFDYEDGLVLTWHPRGRDNCVTIDPRVSFGSPTAGGIATWAIKDRYEAGEPLADISDDFRLEEDQVKDALHFEGLRLSV